MEDYLDNRKVASTTAATATGFFPAATTTTSLFGAATTTNRKFGTRRGISLISKTMEFL